MSKDLVTKWFNKLSTTEQNMPLLILNGLAYTPRQTLDEVTRGTPVGDKLQALIEQDKFGTTFEEEQALLKQRLIMSMGTKPQDKVLFVAIMPGLPVRAFTPAQLTLEIQNGTKVGRQWIDNEASYMKRLLRVR